MRIFSYIRSGKPVVYLKVFAFLCCVGCGLCDFKISVLHINDFHARFEAVDAKYSNKCVPGTEETCVGGFSRITGLIERIKSKLPNAIFLNAGDNYQGTLWYTLFKWNVTATFFSQLPLDAWVPGNHDFDDGVEGLIPFLEMVKDKYPTVAANMDTSQEPSMTPHIKKSVVIERNGRKIGIIGYDLHKFPEMTRTGKLAFSDEAAAVTEEAQRLKEQGVNIIIGLSHSGVEKDIEVAKKVDLLDIIVGGHSHTFMYTGTPPSYDRPYSEYPLVVTQKSGRKVLVVQASAYSRYMGNLSVTFNDEGEVINYEGNPILLDHDIPTDKKIDSQLHPYKLIVDHQGTVVVGHSKVDIQASMGVCYRQECNMGNFVTDSMVFNYIDAEHDVGWTQAAIAIMNAGGMRTSIDKGNITYADVLEVLPFQGTIDAVSVNGSTLIEIIEFTLSSHNFLQWSGAEMTIDPQKPAGSRVIDLKVLCTECEVPRLEPVDLKKYYRVIIPSFMYRGGDGYVMFARNGKNHTVGTLDSEGFFKYLERSNPVMVGVEERIHLLNSIKQPRDHITVFG